MTVATSGGSTPENRCANSLVTAEKSSAGGTPCPTGGGNVERRRVQGEEAFDFGADRRENLCRRGVLSDERCDAPQRRLLFRETRERFARLGVCDRRRDKFAELLQAFVGVKRQRFVRG